MTMLPVPFDELVEGTRFETRGRTVTEADVVAFAGQTGDWHPQHSDAEWAGQSEFGERIAHGMLVLSYSVGLLAFDPDRVLALRRVADAVFKRPVRLGDTIRARGAVQTCAPVSDEAGLVTLAFQIINQYDQTVVRARVEVVWRRERVAVAPDMDNVPDNGFMPIPL
jgi:3-hydroxybutyryl-CoA dehydratase